jgi:hypothetical protein
MLRYVNRVARFVIIASLFWLFMFLYLVALRGAVEAQSYSYILALFSMAISAYAVFVQKA